MGAEVRLPDKLFVLGIVLLAVGGPDIGFGATDRSSAATFNNHLAQGKTMMRLAQASPLADLPPGSLDTDSKNSGEIYLWQGRSERLQPVPGCVIDKRIGKSERSTAAWN